MDNLYHRIIGFLSSSPPPPLPPPLPPSSPQLVDKLRSRWCFLWGNEITPKICTRHDGDSPFRVNGGGDDVGVDVNGDIPLAFYYLVAFSFFFFLLVLLRLWTRKNKPTASMEEKKNGTAPQNSNNRQQQGQGQEQQRPMNDFDVLFYHEENHVDDESASALSSSSSTTTTMNIGSFHHRRRCRQQQQQRYQLLQPVALLGPKAPSTLEFNTWTPPPPIDMSRNVMLPSKPKHSIHSKLVIDLEHLQLIIMPRRQTQQQQQQQRRRQQNEIHRNDRSTATATTTADMPATVSKKTTKTRTEPSTASTTATANDKRSSSSSNVKGESPSSARLFIPVNRVSNVTALTPVEGGVLQIIYYSSSSGGGGSKHSATLNSSNSNNVSDDHSYSMKYASKKEKYDYAWKDDRVTVAGLPDNTRQALQQAATYSTPTVQPNDEVAQFCVGKHTQNQHYHQQQHRSGFDEESSFTASGANQNNMHTRQPGQRPAATTLSPSSATTASKSQSQQKQKSSTSASSNLTQTTQEHTFESPMEATQFQNDLLGIQVVGREILNLYQAFELINLNSNSSSTDTTLVADSATTGKSPRDGGTTTSATSTEKKGTTAAATDTVNHFKDHFAGGVAVDDVMRCLGAIPSIRRQLERHFDHHYSLDATDDLFESSDQGVAKRLHMGRVDFFRLFLPLVDEEDSSSSSSKNDKRIPIPKQKLPIVSPRATDAGVRHHNERMKHLLLLRKKMASVAVLVRAYVRAKAVANIGWNVPRPIPPVATNPTAAVAGAGADTPAAGTKNEGKQEVEKSETLPSPPPCLTKRLSYDLEVDNLTHDAKAANEYYEATVSRDVHFLPPDQRRGAGAGGSDSSMCSYQAYMLVGVHSFALPTNDSSSSNNNNSDNQQHQHSLHYKADPVMTIPSLREIVEAHPDLDFLVHACYPKREPVAIIVLFVRALPRGVDVEFDRALDRYMAGEQKDRTLNIFVQLGPGYGISPMFQPFVRIFFSFLGWDQGGRASTHAHRRHRGERTSFPGVKMRHYADTVHFGGAIRSEGEDTLHNYVAFNTHVDACSVSNLALRILWKKAEARSLPKLVADFTFALSGDRNDEVTNRALASVRLVHVNAIETALPVECSCSSNSDYAALAETEGNGEAQAAAPPVAPEPPESSQLPSKSILLSRRSRAFSEDAASSQSARLDADVDALNEILEGVTVPVRRSVPSNGGILSSDSTASSSPTLRMESTGETVVSAPILELMNRNDLQRFLVASEGDLKTCAVRIVESAAWRGMTFPIDTRVCRVELQSGQFFQQGHDLQGNPVFYFRNMCKGPWRRDVDATVFAVLHRLETAMMRLSKAKPDVRCTLIVLMGKPVDSTATTNSDDNDETSKANNGNKEEKDDKNEVSSLSTSPSRFGGLWNNFSGADEDHYIHTNLVLVHRLIDLVSRHYPERLAQAFIVPGSGFNKTLTAFGLRAYVPPARTRARITILSLAEQLLEHVAFKELLTIVGGGSKMGESNAHHAP